SFDLNLGRGRESAWLGKVFYSYANRVISSDAVNYRQLQLLGEVSDETTPEAALDAATTERLLTGLGGALQQLPEAERRAVELYYGLAEGEHTFAQIATALSCSEYHARAAVLRGLARLAGLLGVQGELDDEEFRFVSAYFGEGRELEAT